MDNKRRTYTAASQMRNLYRYTFWMVYLVQKLVTFPKCSFPFQSNQKTKLAASISRKSARSFSETKLVLAAIGTDPPDFIPDTNKSLAANLLWPSKVLAWAFLRFLGELNATVALPPGWLTKICYWYPSLAAHHSTSQYSRDEFWMERNNSFIQETDHLGRRWTLV